MTYALTVMTADGEAILFAGKTPDRSEALAVAEEAARRQPSAKVYVSAFGRRYEWRDGSLIDLTARRRRA